MRRVIRRRIRRTGDGFDLAADINADISINVAGNRPRPVEEDRQAAEERPPERPASEEPNDQEGSEA